MFPDLKKGILGDFEAEVHQVEFQKRGLPHVHILVILKARSKPTSPSDYDRLVSAELPDPIAQPELFALVQKHMIHGPCGSLNRDSVCMKNNKCGKDFPKS